MANALYQRIEERLKAAGLTAAAVSRAAGLSPDAIRNIKRTGGAHARTLEALAEPLGTSVQWLMTGEPHEQLPNPDPSRAAPNLSGEQLGHIPIMGTAAGTLGRGAFQLSSDPIDYIARPPALRGARNAYAVFVENDSMSPAHPPGALRIVHPDKPVVAGDTVVVQVMDGPNEPYRSYIKTLVKTAGDFIVCRQMNPEANIQFKRTSVVRMHKILTTNEILGV